MDCTSIRLVHTLQIEFNGRLAFLEVIVVLCEASMFTSTSSIALTDRLNTIRILESGHSNSEDCPYSRQSLYLGVVPSSVWIPNLGPETELTAAYRKTPR